MEINPLDLPHESMYKLMVGSIVPRPIAWVSTLAPDGQPNLAPFSFFNAVCPKPPTLLFVSNIRNTDGSPKDTLSNIRATGEFVVNIVSEGLAEAMNLTSTELPAEVDEFALAGVTPVPSAAVKPPRVSESLIHFECRLMQIIDISDQPGGGSVVLGEIVHLHVDDSVLIGDDKINLAALKPVGRLAGAAYTRVTDLFDLMRPPSQIPPRK